MDRIALVLVPLAFALGCASANLQVVRPLQQPVRKVSLSLETAGSTTMTAEQMSRLRTTLTSSLVSSGITVVPKGEGAASLEGVIDRYDPGIRVLRYFFGLYGAGKGTFQSTWRVTDATGSNMGECRIDGSISMGVFGGSYDDVLEKAAVQLRNCLVQGR